MATGRSVRALAVLAALASTMLGSFTSSASAARPTAAPSALPQSQLHFGLASDPAGLSWMTSTGVPWRYRYQYLSAGVNTGNGWETWNSPTGAFATLYMNASNSGGYIPVFTYYEILQSSPSTGPDESSRDFSNLNNAATMLAYYSNFKLLMQLAGSYGKTVVVQVEPDMWGYLQQRAGGGVASSLTASVASSGFAEAGGIPNTVQGFAWTLLKLRDTYAPNASLAIHASLWASGVDIASDTRSAINGTSVADSTAAFLNSAGIGTNPYGSTWDLVFNDVDDHDAGWWEKQGADGASFTHWWDPSNTRFPNFTRYLAWVAEMKARTGRPQVVWQVPVGNQYYLTMNNTCGHYQDNVAAYFINNAASLFASGLIAVLFGAGNACQTSNTDAQHDGVTNAASATTDILGFCNACNTHPSTVADDDGGFLRVFVGQYYAASTPLPFKGLYTLDAWGGVHADSSPAVSTSAYWPGWKIARSAKAYPGAGSVQNGFVLDGWGGLHGYGSSPPAETSGANGHYWPGWDIARDFAFLPDGTGGFVLDGWGGLHAFRVNGSTAPLQAQVTAYWPGWDIARKLVVFSDGSGGYVMDAWGGLHPFGINGPSPVTQVSQSAYWPGWSIARDVVLVPGGSNRSGYVLDGWGGLHAFHPATDSAPGAAPTTAYWPGWDIARSVFFLSGSSTSGYTLDGWGGIHPFGTAPALSGYAYWPGWDIAREIWGD